MKPSNKAVKDVSDEIKTKCTVCDGWGKHEIAASPSHLMEIKCNRCNGSGRVGNEDQ